MGGGTIGGTLGTALGVALAPETGGLSLAIPGFAGAAGSALGGALTGSKNMWRDALLGGLGGVAGGGLNNLTGGGSGLGALFNGGSGAASQAPEMLAQGFGPNADVLAQGFGKDAITSSGALGGLSKFAPYAGLAGAAMLADRAMSPTQVGPPMQQHPTSRPVRPMNRTSQTVDPNSYLTSGGNRSYFTDINPQVQYMAKGGPVGLGNGLIANSSNKNPTPYPVMGKKHGVMRYYADGGSSSASSSNIPLVKGRGDGKSDSIPAMLSDGEYVFSAPAVSALGKGSNDAGARKLDKMHKGILKKNYKKGAVGLGAMH